MKNKIGLSQFFKNNTPKFAQIIGDVSLVLAFVASAPLILASAGVAVPAALVTAAVYATTGGSLIKIVTKTIGVKLPDEEQQ